MTDTIDAIHTVDMGRISYVICDAHPCAQKIRKWLESAAKLFQVVPQWKGERFALDCQPEAALGWGPLVPCLWADCWKLHWNFTEDLLCLWYVSDNSDVFMICRRCAYVLNELCFRCHLGKPHRLSISQYLSRAVCDFFFEIQQWYQLQMFEVQLKFLAFV